MPEQDLDAFGMPIDRPGSAPHAAPSAHGPDSAAARRPDLAPEPDRPRRTFVPVLFCLLALVATGVMLWQVDREALDAPQVVARGLDGHALGEASLLREANLRRALRRVKAEMEPDEELLSLRLTPGELATTVRDANGNTRLVDVNLSFEVDARDWSTDTSSTPLRFADIDPAAPQRIARAALRQAGADDTHLDYLSLSGGTNPSWYVAIEDVPIGKQTWSADLAGVAVTKPGELPFAEGVEGRSLMRPANLSRALERIRQHGRRISSLRIAPERIDVVVRGDGGNRSVQVDAALRVTVSDYPGTVTESIDVDRVPPGALERAVTKVAARGGVSAKRIDYAVLFLVPAVAEIPVSWTLFFEDVPQAKSTWRASFDGRTVEGIG